MRSWASALSPEVRSPSSSASSQRVSVTTWNEEMYPQLEFLANPSCGLMRLDIQPNLGLFRKNWRRERSWASFLSPEVRSPSLSASSQRVGVAP